MAVLFCLFVCFGGKKATARLLKAIALQQGCSREEATGREKKTTTGWDGEGEGVCGGERERTPSSIPLSPISASVATLPSGHNDRTRHRRTKVVDGRIPGGKEWMPSGQLQGPAPLSLEPSSRSCCDRPGLASHLGPTVQIRNQTPCKKAGS